MTTSNPPLATQSRFDKAHPSPPSTGCAIRSIYPPGPTVHDLHIDPSTGNINHSFSSSLAYTPPQLFRDAITVRAEVFVLEQRCSAAEEIDAEDGRSWHWVVYTGDEALEGRREEVMNQNDEDGNGEWNGEGGMAEGESRLKAGGEEKDVFTKPAATIRLVPISAHPHIDSEEGAGPKYSNSTLWDHREPYVKIGRLATISTYRGRGYGRILVQAALAFAAGNQSLMGEGWRGLVLAHAQIGVVGWYRGLGFRLDEGMGKWWEEGIEHVGMWVRVGMESVGDEGKRRKGVLGEN